MQQISETPEKTLKCAICFENRKKYTCPACETKTCSLSCYKAHKEKLNCRGTLQIRKFIKKKDMSLKTLRRDQRYIADEITKSNKVLYFYFD